MLTSLKKIFGEHFVLIIALVITSAVYFKFLYFGHISWDDPEMVFRNKAVKEFDLKAIFTGNYVGNYLPFTMLLHAITWRIFENNDGGHHLVNILLHLLNGVLVYFIAARFFSHKKACGLTALIFLLHPLQLESVGWISELKNTLSASFYFASVLYYLRYSENKRQSQYLFAFLFFVAGCLSKSSVVILPLSLLCIDFFLHQGFKVKFLLNKIPFLIVSLIFGVINLKTQAADMFINYSHAFPYHERLGYAGYALFKYLCMFLCPYNLSVLYPYPSGKVFALIIGFTFLALMGFLIYKLYKNKNYTLLALVFLCVSSLALVLQFVPFGEVLYADRYMYIPLVFFTMLVLFLIQKIKLNLNYVLFFIAIVLPVITFFRMDAWKSSTVLYSDVVKKFPGLFVALNSLGAELMMQNNDVQALDYLNRSVKAAPQNYKGYYNRGLLSLKTNKPKDAIDDFNRVIKLYDYHKAYIGRASAYYMIQDIPKALKDANYVLQKEPRHAKAFFVIANCYNSLNKLDSAILFYNKCIEITNDDADFYFKRAITYGKKKDFTTCLTDLNECIRLNPLYFEAYYWRGIAKFNLKQNPCEDLKIAGRNNIEPAVQAFNRYCR